MMQVTKSVFQGLRGHGAFVLTTLFAFFLFSSTAFAQSEPAVKEDLVQVKLTESAKAAFVGQQGALPEAVSNARTGIAALDQIAEQFDVVRMERVFRPAGQHEARHVEWGLDRWYMVEFQADAAPASVAEAYLATAEVAEGSPVYEKALHRIKNTRASDDSPEAIPNDPRYDDQWHYDNTGQTGGTPDADINLPEAHDITTGSPNVVISVLDSGLDLDHPDFQGMLWINDAEDINGNGVFDPEPVGQGGDLNGVDDDNNGFVDDVVGYDHADDDPIPSASGDHGTHVAGTVGAKNGNGQFGAGVAGGDGSSGSGVRLMITQTFSNAVGGFAEGIVYAADNGAIVSQNSWGYTSEGTFEQAVLDAIDYFRANAGGSSAPMDGGVFVNSSGNSDSSGEWYPGFYEPSYAVSSTEDTDTKSSFSNYGDWIDVAAPGGQFGEDGVWSTVVGGFGSQSGTSMAAPHVSGVIGLVASASPGLTNDQMETLLINTGKDISGNQPQRMGPRVDAFAALQSVGDDEVPPAAITDLATVGVSENTVDLEWTAPGDDGNSGTATSYDIRWSLDPIETLSDFEEATQLGGEPTPAESGTVQSFTAENLPFGSEVYFSIRTADEVGNFSEISNSPSATTEPGPRIGVDPESFLVDLQTGESTERELTISNLGDPGAGPLTFTATVGSGGTAPSDVSAPATTEGSGDASAFATESEPSSGDGTELGPTATTYQIDDGTSENSLGLTNGGDTMWLNAFQVVEGSGTITEISSAFGSSSGSGLPTDKPVRFLVYEDPNDDGNPEDAVLLTQVDTEVQDPHTDTFVTESIEPTQVDGVFFIAALYQQQEADTFPAPMDESSEFQESSWIVGNSTPGGFNVDDLSANDVAPANLGDINFPANWLLRAEGGENFLAVSPTEGSVAQGESQTLTATFDAASLAPGTYEATIGINSNDPAQPITNVPSTLEVTAGPPNIVADPEALDFGQVLVGAGDIRTFTLNNTGGTELDITNINITNGDYTLADSDDQNGFSIPFGESRDVEVEFAPSSTGASSGSIVVNTSQGVSALVSVDGEGLPAPAFAFSPEELTGTAQPGETTDVPFTITNEGQDGSTLEFTFPAFASQDLLNNPDVPRNDTSRPIENSDHEKGDDVHEGVGHPVVTGAGGPDPFGYTWIDSNEPGGPAFSWVDITGEGTAIDLSDDDFETVSLPFDFSFYGDTKTEVKIGSNGYLTFGEDGTDFGNDPIPNTNAPNDGIFPFWDDLDPGDGQGTIHYLNDTENGRFIVQYTDVPDFPGPDGPQYTFQVILNSDGSIRYQYLDMDESEIGGATTGIEDATGEVGLQVAFNTPYVEDELAVVLARKRDFIADVTPSSGTVTAGESIDLTTTFDAEGLEPDVYDDPLTPLAASTNDPANMSTTIPSVLTVEEGPPTIALEPDSIDYGSYLIGNMDTQTFTIVNDGAGPLNVESVSSTNGDFTLVNADDEGPFTIPLFGSRDIEVMFAPSSVGDISGAIEVTSDAANASTASVTVQGEGLPAPTLAFSPDPITNTLLPGETGDATLTVSNEGMTGSTLDYSFPGFAAMDLIEDPDVPQNNTSSVIDDPGYQRNEADGGGDPHAGIGNPVVTGAGGPDGFGYTWIDSNESGGPSFMFTDISDIGTPLDITDDFGASPSPEVGLPFTFEFYGEAKNSVRVDNNGFIHFDSPSDNYFVNAEIPNTNDPNGVVAAFWDDLDPAASGAEVLTYHDETGGRFIIQWDEVPAFFGDVPMTFQIVLNSDGSMRFNILDIDEGDNDSATTGIENATGEDGLQVAFNTPYPEDSLSIAITPPVDFITDVDPASGSVSNGQSQDVSFTFSAEGLVPGSYAQVPPVALTSNDPTNVETSTPAELTVESGPPTIAVEPDSIGFGSLLVGDDSTGTITITNDGDGPLNVSSVSTTNGNFTIVDDADRGPFTVPLFESRDVEVEFAPTDVGPESGQILVQSDAQNTGLVQVAVTGEGLPSPTIGVTPTSLSEELRLGASSEQTLTVSNTGDVDLDFTASVGTGSNTTPSDVSARAPSGTSGGDASMLATSTTPYDGPPTEVGPTATTYQLDDGSSENGLGLTNGGDIMWLNAYEVVEGAGTITEISSAFGCNTSNEPSCSENLPGGTTVRYFVYNDPNNDGDPSDAVLLTETEAVTEDPHTDTFVSSSVEGTEVEGTFFIAALYEGHTGSQFPAPMDESSDFQQASWIVGDGGGNFNSNDLSDNGLPPSFLGDIDFPANWLLRAEGTSGSSFVAVSPSSGTVAPGESTDLTVNFDAGDLDADTYEADINIASNDPAANPFTVPASLTVFDACPTAWELEIATSASQTDSVSVLTLGQGPYATGGLDNEFVGNPTQPGEADCNEVQQPPIPPSPTVDFRFVDNGLPGVDLGQGTFVDIRPDTASTGVPQPTSGHLASANWRINLQSGTYPITMSWDNASLADDLSGSIRLVDAATGGNLVSVDMKENGSASISNSAIGAVEVRVGSSSHQMTTTEGWNFKSIPVFAPNMAFGSLMQICESAFGFAPGSGYTGLGDNDPMEVGEGYFANCASGTFSMNGEPLEDKTIDVEDGWNAVGALDQPVDVSSITASSGVTVESSFFGFDPVNGYTVAETLNPTEAYWVNVSGSGTLDLSGTGTSSASIAAKASRSGEFSAPGTRLVITDSQGQSATLHVGQGLSDAELKRHALPPKPPTSVFDVRFSNGQSAASFSAKSESDTRSFQALDMQGVSYPVTLRLDGGEQEDALQVKRFGGADALDASLTPENPSVTLSKAGGTVKVGMRTVPSEFTLERSYPNPTRQRATIEYAVPKEADVTLEVYDVLGRRVARLVDETKRAGTHSIELDASRLPSGTYFYRMRAGDFVKTHRMVVVR